MKFICNVDKKEYDDFVVKHSAKSHFLQSYAWGEVSKTKGLIPHYVGLEENGKLIAASLLLQKRLPFGYSYFYAPRGYVLDYSKIDVLEKFTIELKNYAKNKKGIFIKLDPDIKLHNIDLEGQEINDNFDNYQLIKELTKLGYKHLGFNKNFEHSQPRYTFRLDLDQPLDQIKTNMHPTTRKILNRDNPYQLEVTLGNEDDIKDFFELMKVTSKRDGFVNSSLEYYQHFYSILNKYNMSDIYFIKVSISDIIAKTEKMIESTKNDISKMKNEGKKQDQLSKLHKLENDLEEYKEYPKKYPDSLIISAIITVKYGDKVWTIHGGNHNIFRNLNSNYLLYYYILVKAKEEGYKTIDFFGTTGNPTPDNKIYGIHLFKKRFGGEYTEFIGEFDLIINKPMYFLFTKVVPLYRRIIRHIRDYKNRRTVK